MEAANVSGSYCTSSSHNENPEMSHQLRASLFLCTSSGFFICNVKGLKSLISKYGNITTLFLLNPLAALTTLRHTSVIFSYSNPIQRCRMSPCITVSDCSFFRPLPAFFFNLSLLSVLITRNITLAGCCNFILFFKIALELEVNVENKCRVVYGQLLAN